MKVGYASDGGAFFDGLSALDGRVEEPGDPARSTSFALDPDRRGTAGGPSFRMPRCRNRPATPCSTSLIEASSTIAMPPVSVVSAGLPRVMAVFDR